MYPQKSLRSRNIIVKNMCIKNKTVPEEAYRPRHNLSKHNLSQPGGYPFPARRYPISAGGYPILTWTWTKGVPHLSWGYPSLTWTLGYPIMSPPPYLNRQTPRKTHPPIVLRTLAVTFHADLTSCTK